MAKEKNLPSKTTLTTSYFIRVVGSDNASYKQDMASLLSLISDRLLELPPSNDFDAVPKTSGHLSFFRWGSDTLNSPFKANAGASDTGAVASFYSGANYGVQFGISSNREEEYIRKLGGGTWGSWVKLPTRAEVDALWVVETKTVSVPDVSAGSTAWCTASVTKSGYTPVGIVGWYFTGGTANTWLFPYAMRTGSANTNIAIRNLGGVTSTGVSVDLDILYRKS